MDCEVKVFEVAKGEVELVRKLVEDELDRRFAKIDDIVVAQYRVMPNYHTEAATAAVKVAVLELVRSPLAMLERKLSVEPVKVEDQPV